MVTTFLLKKGAKNMPKKFSNPLINAQIEGYLKAPDKYVYSFAIPEKGKVRNIITYNEAQGYGKALRVFHERFAEEFSFHFCDRNAHSFAYHEKVRCLDALQDHLKSDYFIKLDIHQFFESITKERFFEIYGKRFNKRWKEIIPYAFYRESLSIGFVSSPLISDYFMSDFDEAVEGYLANHPELHYSRYSDDILLSSEGKDDGSLNGLFEFVQKQLALLHLELNEKKTRRAHLEFGKNNAVTFLGLNLSKADEVNNKITISKRYILFLLFLIEKNARYHGKCRELVAEIKSRVAYLKMNSPISYERFQKKHQNIYGYPYTLDQTELQSRNAGAKSSEIEGYADLSKEFELKLHSSVSVNGMTIVRDGIELVKYKGLKDAVEVPKIINILGSRAFSQSPVKKVTLHQGIQAIGQACFEGSPLEEIELPKSCVYIAQNAFARTSGLKRINIPKNLKKIPANCFASSGLSEVAFEEGCKLQSIEPNAFRASKVKEIDLPDTVKEIGPGCFASCEDLKRVSLGKLLQEIPNDCFLSCPRLTEFAIPDNVLKLGPNAFGGCVNLKRLGIGKGLIALSRASFDADHPIESISIDEENPVYASSGDDIVEKESKTLIYAPKDCRLPEDIEIIGPYAFAGSLIEEADLTHIKAIGQGAFRGCRFLKRVQFGDGLAFLAPQAFEGCGGLTSIALPSSLKAIPSSCFALCLKLENVHLPDALERIGEKAFFNDGELSALDLPESLVRIDHEAFGNCYNIKSIHIGKNVKRISHSAFAGLSKNLDSIAVDKGNLSYSDGDGCHVLIDSQRMDVLLGCKHSRVPQNVKHIRDYAFAYCQGLTSIDLPESVVSIGKRAFLGCPDLEEVKAPGLISVGAEAFYRCGKLSKCELPESLIEIGASSFARTSLEEVIIPDSIFRIGQNAFSHNDALKKVVFPSVPFAFNETWFECCGNIDSIDVGEDNPDYPRYPNSNALVKKDEKGKTSVVFACKNTVIPEGIDSLSWTRFGEIHGLKEFVIPKGCALPKPLTFANCFELEKVQLPEDLEELPEGVFRGCMALESIELPESLVRIGQEAFHRCVSLRKIRLGENVREMGCGVFSGCAKLEEAIIAVNVPESNTFRLLDETFAGCRSLKTVRFEKEYGRIEAGDYAFCRCSALSELPFDKDIVSFGKLCFDGCESLTLHLGDNVESIGFKAFAGVKGFEHIHIPSSTSRIDGGAFFGCPIESIEVDPNNKAYFGKDVIVGKRDGALVQGCKHSIIPAEAKQISAYAFAGTAGLASIEIPSGVKRIDASAFEDCPDLSEVVFNPGLTHILNEAFHLCKSLSKVTFPDTLIQIRGGAFSSCANLREVRFGDGPAPCRVELGAFDDCPNLETFDLGGKNSIDLSSAFDGSREHLSNLIVPKDAYRSLECGIAKGDILCIGRSYGKIDPSIRCIGTHAFTHVDGPSSLVLPEGIEEIEPYAFERCEGIEEIVLPSSLKRLYPLSFSGCQNIKRFVVHPDNPYFEVKGNAIIVKADGSALMCCKLSALEEGVRSLKEGCFANAEGLKELMIPSTLSLNSSSALWPLTNLMSIKVAKNHPALDDRGGDCIVKTASDELLFALSPSKIDTSITRFGDNCFARDDSVTSFVIPKQIRFLRSHSLGCFAKLASVDVDPDNPVFRADASHTQVLAVSNGKRILAIPSFEPSEDELNRRFLLSGNVGKHRRFSSVFSIVGDSGSSGAFSDADLPF